MLSAAGSSALVTAHEGFLGLVYDFLTGSLVFPLADSSGAEQKHTVPRKDVVCRALFGFVLYMCECVSFTCSCSVWFFS